MKVVSNDIITMSNWANHHEEIIAWKKIRDELRREYRMGLTFALCNNLRHLYNTFAIDYTVYLSMQMKIDLEGEHLLGIEYRPRIDLVWPRYDYRSRKCFIDNQIKRLESYDTIER